MKPSKKLHPTNSNQRDRKIALSEIAIAIFIHENYEP
jgi:hypothetical protein